MAGNTATIETLTAEVCVLVVGSRQVTMSVYNQLDYADFDQIEPFGRVTPKDARDGIYVIGKRRDGGDLVRSVLPATAAGLAASIKRESSADTHEREAAAHQDKANRRDKAADTLDETAEKLLGDNWIPGHDAKSTHGAVHHDQRAAKLDEDAAQADRDAQGADTETDRLARLADAARCRHEAATEREQAAQARAESEQCRARAQEHRQEAQESRHHADASMIEHNTWVDWEKTRTGTATKTTAEWSALPLIVLAGLR